VFAYSVLCTKNIALQTPGVFIWLSTSQHILTPSVGRRFKPPVKFIYLIYNMKTSMKLLLCALFCLATALAVSAEIYFEDNFPDGMYYCYYGQCLTKPRLTTIFIWFYYHSTESFESEWVYSEYPGKEFGKFVYSSGAFYNDVEADKGIQTSQDFRFYALSKKFTPFSNEGKDLVIQFTVKHEQNIDCGGGYIKLFNCSLEQKELHGETPYEIMFGKYMFLIFYLLSRLNYVSLYMWQLDINKKYK